MLRIARNWRGSIYTQVYIYKLKRLKVCYTHLTVFFSIIIVLCHKFFVTVKYYYSLYMWAYYIVFYRYIYQ